MSELRHLSSRSIPESFSGQLRFTGMCLSVQAAGALDIHKYYLSPFPSIETVRFKTLKWC